MEKKVSKTHSHSHSHAHHHDHHGDVKNIKVAFFLNFGFAIIEIIGGFLTNSVAILSDAVHDLGDSLSLGLAWYFQKYSRKKSDSTYTYGYRRFSLVGALANSLVLIVGSILILTEAIPRIFNPQQAHPQGMMMLAVLGIAVNGVAMLRLRRGKSLNEKVVSLHLMEDVLGWIAVLVGAIADQQDHVDATTQPRNRVLEVETRGLRERCRKLKLLQEPDLLLPGIALIELNIVACVPNDLTKDLVLTVR